MNKIALTALLAISLPLAAQDEPVDYQVTELSKTISMLKGRGGNMGVSVGEDGLFIIDDQLAPITDQLLAALRRISDEPIRFVINTHYHGDHTGGNETIGEAGGVIIAHDNIHQRMTTEQVSIFMQSTTPPYPHDALPVVTFNDHVTMHLNGEAATAYHVPHAHTDGDSIVHFPQSDVVHMGDIFFNKMYPYIDLDAGGSFQGMIAGAELGLSLAGERTRIIPGHGPLATRAELAAYRDFLTQARDQVQALIDQDMTLEQAIAAKPTAQWDEQLGEVWITPAQFVTFIYNSLTGVNEFTRVETKD
jgi:glyoxylase-like metal-dependent hydrolase (beta-lactamase superfamily II)